MTTAASGDSSNNNSSNNTSPASFNLAGDAVPLTTAVPSSSSLSLTSSRDRCRRCEQLVYCTERIGPVKNALYHKLCFKCLKCDRQLDFKTYFTNSIDLTDKEIYCQSHVPRSGKGVFSTENMHIQNVMRAPKLNVMQKLDDRFKVNLILYLTYKMMFFSRVHILILNQFLFFMLSKLNKCFNKVEKK
jgi:hypothetical protein